MSWGAIAVFIKTTAHFSSANSEPRRYQARFSSAKPRQHRGATGYLRSNARHHGCLTHFFVRQWVSRPVPDPLVAKYSTPERVWDLLFTVSERT